MKINLRYFLISLFFLSLIGLTIPLIVYNLNNRNPDPTALIITGNVSREVSFTYEDIISGKYGVVENRIFTFLNQPPYNSQYDVNYTGVSVWALLTYTSILYPNATSIYFKSWDAYRTETLSLSAVQDNPEDVIVAFKKGDYFLQNNSEDGGPLRTIVDLSVTEPDYCSKYWAKYVNEIVVE